MISHHFRNEHGFTLVEMLVAMLTGLVVVGAAFAILEVSLHQSTRIADRVSADQRGRLALEKILLELHSACVATGAAPIQENSEGTKLRFLSESGSSEPFFTKGVEHEIYLSGTTLKDAVYQSNGGVEANGGWKFPAMGSPTSTSTLLTNVYAPTTGTMFEYFSYTASALTTALTTFPLKKEAANSAAKINVNLTVAPESGDTRLSRPVSLSGTAVLRLTPATETSAPNLPCE
ncbi:MAG: PilW family protein [Solirubrobacteraceae bacterium]